MTEAYHYALSLGLIALTVIELTGIPLMLCSVLLFQCNERLRAEQERPTNELIAAGIARIMQKPPAELTMRERLTYQSKVNAAA